MARIHELLRQLRMTGVTNDALADEIEREYDVVADRRAFGLNFERHTPEAVELPGRPVRTGDKVHVLPARGSIPINENDRLWRVTAIDGRGANRIASLEPYPALDGAEGAEGATQPVSELVVVAEFRDPIYPGLMSTGKVERGGDKPYHAVINAENYHALQTLLFTHRGKVDAIYIDPPYNTGAKDWKYNNDYVEGDDLYRHSKWLAFMERRLLLAKELLNPDDSVLIVTIDEKEYLRLGLLLEQTFPEASMSMVSSVINPAGAGRNADFSRTDEYLYFVRLGVAAVSPEQRAEEQRPVTWDTLRRSDLSSVRPTRPAQFYPIYVNESTGLIEEIGDPLSPNIARQDVLQRPGCVAVLPVRPDGTEMNWGITPETAKKRLADGHLRAGRRSPGAPQEFAIAYLTGGIVADIESGRVVVTGRANDGSVVAHYVEGRLVMPTTHWNRPSHDAQRYGTETLKRLIPGQRFPFPKSLYAVEDCLRMFIREKRDAIVVDFFAGSGTTTHAVMRLNRQDGGRRVSISVSNNEVSSNEHAALRARNLRPGDGAWEELGICDHITKPRIAAAVTGETPVGDLINGEYSFTDVFPMADGFDENVEFFTMTYEAPLRLRANRDFEKVAPLLWLRAGSRGSRIDSLPEGWAVVDAYGVISDLDQTDKFLAALNAADRLTHAFVITDDDSVFEAIVAELPDGVEPIRLYDAYLRNFEIDAMRGVR